MSAPTSERDRTSANKFFFRKYLGAGVGALIRSKDLMVLKASDTHLSEGTKQEIAAVNLITGRRKLLKTFALSLTTSAIASAAAKRAAMAVEPALIPPGAARLEALKKRLAQTRTLPELQQVGLPYGK